MGPGFNCFRANYYNITLGEGVSEMRIHVGPGQRACFTRRAEVVYLLLLGGDKSSQKRDIKRAIEMARVLDQE